MEYPLSSKIEKKKKAKHVGTTQVHGKTNGFVETPAKIFQYLFHFRTFGWMRRKKKWGEKSSPIIIRESRSPRESERTENASLQIRCRGAGGWKKLLVSQGRGERSQGFFFPRMNSPTILLAVHFVQRIFSIQMDTDGSPTRWRDPLCGDMKNMYISVKNQG